MKRIVLLCSICSVILWGCGKTNKVDEITVLLDWTPNTNHTGLYVADALGFFAEENIKVNIIQPSEGTAATLVAAGKAHFGFSYQEEVTYALTADEPLPIIALAAVIQQNTSGFASLKEKKILSPVDFKGKRYGGWGAPMEEMLLRDLMNRIGGDFSTIKMVNIGASDFFTASKKEIDFGWIFYGWDGIRAETTKTPINFTYLRDIDTVYEYYTPVIITNTITLQTNKKLAARFMKALARGYEYAIAEPDKSADLLIKAVPEFATEKEFIYASQRYLSQHYRGTAAQWGMMDGAIWKRFGDWMFSNMLITRPLKSEAAFTNDFIPAP